MGDPAYIAGDNWVVCDECGFKTRSSQTKMRWDNLRVCLKDWEPRHPQDFVRAKRDQQRVPNARPEQPDVFLEVNQVTEDNLSGIITPISVEPGSASILFSGFAPDLLVGAASFPGSASVTYAGHAPRMVIGQIARPGSASITFAGFAPEVDVSLKVYPGPASVTYTGFAPTVDVGSAIDTMSDGADQYVDELGDSYEFKTTLDTMGDGVGDQYVDDAGDSYIFAS